MSLSIDLTVADVAKSAEFYRLLGYEVPNLWEQGGVPHHVDIPDGPMLNSMQLTKGYDPAWPGVAGAVFIHHVTSRALVDEQFAALTAAGYRSHLEPFDAFWGARYAIVDDPDGNHIGIMSPSDAEHTDAQIKE
jgi:predicted lactoylglutathione lyase